MIHRGMTWLCFHQTLAGDERYPEPGCVSHSNTIWLNGQQAKVENRENVREEMRTFLRDCMGCVFMELEGEGPPDDKEPDEEPPAQRQRVLHLG